MLSIRDCDSKVQGKKREDLRRKARECRVKPGDHVIIERQTRGKGESRFHPRKYTVDEENNGMLVLSDESGQIIKRHVSQTRKVFDWRETNSHKNDKSTYLPTSNPETQGDGQVIRRSDRNRRSPVHLKHYFHAVEQRQVAERVDFTEIL